MNGRKGSGAQIGSGAAIASGEYTEGEGGEEASAIAVEERDGVACD